MRGVLCNRNSGVPVRRHPALVFLAVSLFVAGPGKALAATPKQLCLGGSGPAGSLTNGAALDRATTDAEAVLLQAEANFLLGDSALERLVVADVPGPVSPASLAAYCSAAGQAMLIARSGSEYRARSYLVTALGQADLAGSDALRSRILYRLALVSRNLAVRPNARSAKRSLVQDDQPLLAAGAGAGANGEVPADISQDGCDALASDRLDDRSNWSVSRLALECSIAAASGAQGDSQAALGYLQLARLNLTEILRRPEAAAELRELASAAALKGLGPGLEIADAGQRFEYVTRLSEAAIDAGAAEDKRVSKALAALAAQPIADAGQQAMLLALQGRVALASGQAEKAAALFRSAIFQESQSAQPFRLADWFLLLAAADPARRDAHVMQAYDALQAVRSLMPTFDPLTRESTFALRMAPVFSAAVDVQLSQPAAGNPAGQIASAQRVVESFRQAEIQNVFGADCVPPRVPVDPSQLLPGEILLYPILLEDRVELIYATNAGDGSPTQYQRVTQRNNAGVERINRLVKKAAYELGYGTDDSWEAPATELYALLIQPIEGLLKPGSTLVIVPDGILRRLPFAALRDSDGTLLIQKTAIAIAPSLAYTQPGTALARDPSVVAVSLSEAVDLPAGAFGALPGTAAEARMASGLGNPDKPVGLHIDNFRRDQLKAAFEGREIDVLHLATHASFNGRSDRSFIVSDDSAILLSDLRDIISANRTNSEQLALIVLSACETALGDDQASMGLAGTAVQAGAESALASLWEVDDAGTAELMLQFYERYARGEGKAEALRNAQLAMIGSESDFADPRIWAAFTLLGGWR
jgi:CHAT domain-containing protein